MRITLEFFITILVRTCKILLRILCMLFSVMPIKMLFIFEINIAQRAHSIGSILLLAFTLINKL